MSTHRKRACRRLDGGLFLTDGGIETDLIFNDGLRAAATSRRSTC